MSQTSVADDRVLDLRRFLPGGLIRKNNRPETVALLTRRRDHDVIEWEDGTFTLHRLSRPQMVRLIERCVDDPRLAPVAYRASRVVYADDLRILREIDNYFLGQVEAGAYDADDDERVQA